MTDPTPNTGSATGAATLDAVAQAVQSLSRSEASSYKTEPTAAESQAAEDARTAEEISRQLQQADAVPAATM
jgi:osmotically-inducible protein OsmY